jgi:hypothetical protein
MSSINPSNQPKQYANSLDHLRNDDDILNHLNGLDTVQLMRFTEGPNDRVKSLANLVVLSKLEKNVQVNANQDKGLEKAQAAMLARFHENYDITSDGNKGLTLLAKYGFNTVVKELLKNENIDPNPAIAGAAENGQLETLETLLKDSRADPSANNNLALKAASSNGYAEVVTRLLQDKKVNP